ncbi:TMEM179 isoform 6 [Pan troglodytes]|uniref:Uncharacterized protein n=2 Tax=Pan troglodytes TaxID=9598 RepID=A0A2I3SY27_PANTR|nr:uncharacterized protein LOC107968260 [Pan troglodytes]PNI97080.1 TMEM179 isoform 6 [Pan troglodytes]
MCTPVRVSIVCVMGAVGAVWTAPLPLPWAPTPSIHLRKEGAAFPFCRVCVLRPRRGKWRSWDVNLGPQRRGLLGCGPCPSGKPRFHLQRTRSRAGAGAGAGGLPTRGSMRGCPFLGSSAAKCCLLLRPPSRGEASPWLPEFVTHPVHHQQLACVSGWLGTSLLEATCLGPHGGSWWGHHPGSRE